MLGELTGDHSAARRNAGQRVALMVLLALTMAMATAALSVISVLAPFLTDDLGLSRSEIGMAITAVGAGGAATSLFSGRLADRFGGRTMAAAILVSGMLVFVAVGLAVSAIWLLAVALGSGLANGAGNPATNKLIARHFPVGGRGLAIGIKQSGVQAGLFLAGITLPPAALAIGWRTSLMVGATLPAVGLIAILAVVPSDPAPPVAPAVQPSSRYRASHMVRWMTAYGVMMGAGGAAIVSFLPLYVEEGLGMSVTAAGLSASLFGVLGVGGRVVWARSSERLRSFAAPLGVLATIAAAATVFIRVADGGPAWFVWTGTVLAGSSVAAWNAVGMLAIVAREPDHEMGRASGYVNGGFLAGMSMTPAVFGWLVDRTGSYELGWSLVTVLFVCAALVTVIWHRSAPRSIG